MSHIVHRNLLKDPPIAVSGQGIWLRDSTGHDVIDGSGGAAVACRRKSSCPAALDHRPPTRARRGKGSGLAWPHTAMSTPKAVTIRRRFIVTANG